MNEIMFLKVLARKRNQGNLKRHDWIKLEMRQNTANNLSYKKVMKTDFKKIIHHLRKILTNVNKIIKKRVKEVKIIYRKQAW